MCIRDRDILLQCGGGDISSRVISHPTYMYSRWTGAQRGHHESLIPLYTWCIFHLFQLSSSSVPPFMTSQYEVAGLLVLCYVQHSALLWWASLLLHNSMRETLYIHYHLWRHKYRLWRHTSCTTKTSINSSRQERWWKRWRSLNSRHRNTVEIV